MDKRLLWFFVGLIMIVAGGLASWYYLSPPVSFPDKEEVSNIMMSSYPNINISEIQDTIFLDEEHVFAPFITKTDNRGISLWKWKNHDWQLTGVSTGSMPYIWKIEPNVPSTYHIFWNFHPDNDLDHLTFYLMEERGYLISEGIHHYQPGIQLDFKTGPGMLSPYGYSSIPDEWQTFIISENKQLESLKPNPFFSEFFPPPQYYFGWNSTANDGLVVYPAFPDGNGFGSGDSTIEPIRFLEKNEVY